MSVYLFPSVPIICTSNIIISILLGKMNSLNFESLLHYFILVYLNGQGFGSSSSKKSNEINNI